MKRLLKAGANRVARDWDGNTPFMLACLASHKDTALLLVPDGAEARFPSAAEVAAKIKADNEAATRRAQALMSPSGALCDFHVVKAVWSPKECAHVMRCVFAGVFIPSFPVVVLSARFSR